MKSRLFLAASLSLIFCLTAFQQRHQPKMTATASGSVIAVGHSAVADSRQTDFNISFEDRKSVV